MMKERKQAVPIFKLLINTVALALVVVALGGCGSIGKKLKALVGGGSDDEVVAKPAPKQMKYSDAQSAPYDQKNRHYQRMTREKFEQDARLNDNTGSLWVMEGQGSYLFSSNTLRLVGEIVNVKLEGGPKQQLETKVKVIKMLLAKLDKPKKRAVAAVVPGAKPGEPPAAGAPPPPAPDAAADEKNAEKEKDKDDESQFGVDLVPARIVDRTVEGHYRIKGTQSFMIGKREYKVIVTGLVRPADVNGDQVPAPQLLEPKFDIVSLKKEIKL